MPVWRTRDGKYKVELVRLWSVPVVADRSVKLRSASPEHGDGEYLIVTTHGFIACYATSVAELAKYFELSELVRDDDMTQQENDYQAGKVLGESDARAEQGSLPTTPILPGKSAMYQAGYRVGRSKVRNERAMLEGKEG